MIKYLATQSPICTFPVSRFSHGLPLFLDPGSRHTLAVSAAQWAGQVVSRVKRTEGTGQLRLCSPVQDIPGTPSPDPPVVH